MALGLDQFVLPDQEPPLLDVVPFYGSILAVVSHIRLQFGARRLYHSVNELPNIYNSEPPLTVIPNRSEESKISL